MGKSTKLHSPHYRGREGISAYEHNSRPSNIKTQKLYASQLFTILSSFDVGIRLKNSELL